MIALALVSLAMPNAMSKVAIVLGRVSAPPEVLKTVNVNVATDAKKLVMKMPPNPDGSFMMFLEPGVYRMRLAPMRGTGPGGPLRQVVITAGVLNRVFIPSSSVAAGMGRLEGFIEVGPLSPVEKVGEVKIPPPDMFKACNVTLSGPTNKTLSASAHGMFSADLKPGRYTLSTDYKSPRPAAPIDVTVKVGSLTKATISVDSGIR